MRRTHAHPRMDLPISMEIYHQLITASADTGYQKEDWEIAAEAIDEWMRRHKPDAIPMPVIKGYQWKSVFLPDGTLLRTVFDGKNHHCLVEGDQILFNGEPVSPSGFVNAVGGIRRNAWRCTWVLLPETKEWKLADSLRTRERPRRERKQAGASLEGATGQPRNARAPAYVPPAGHPGRMQADPVASGTSEEPHSPPSGLGKVRQSDKTREGCAGPGPAGVPACSPRCRRRTERRVGRADQMSPLLSEELLPLLRRMCAMNEERRSNESKPGRQDRQ
jgi:hypothetical protein